MIKKHNGFNQKPHPYQIISYIYFSTLIGSYFLLLMPLSSDLSKIVGGIFEAILSLVVLISGYLVTAIDPSDPIMKKTKQAELTNTPCDIPVQELYCPADKSYVLTGSKHCRRCNRCTEEFDHHCKWVNNDVGKANYKHFFVLISSVTVFLIVYLACGISLTVDYAKDTHLTENNIYIYSNNSQQILAVMIVLWILMVISAVFLLMAGNLVLLHIYLISKGMTTYQYIIAGDARRAKSQEERAKNGPDYSKRTCLDFILCLKKRKKVVAGTFTLNGDTQKSVNKELNNHSETQTRKMSDFLKKDEAKAELDNTQNEDNICAALPASPRNHTSVSPGSIKEVNVVKKEKIFTFEKGNFDASNRALISKTDAQIEVLKTNQTNRDREEGTSPGRKDQESVHKVQATKIRESTEREHEILEINPHQEKIKADIPLYPAQMRSASAAIEKKNLPAIRSSNHTLFAEEGRSVSQRGFQLPRLTDMNKGEQSLRDKRKYEIPNSSIDNQGL